MAQTQADRSAAAQKAAVTRKRNEERNEAHIAGKKAAGTREEHAVNDALAAAKDAAGDAVSGAKAAAEHVGDAAHAAVKAAGNRLHAAEDEQKK